MFDVPRLFSTSPLCGVNTTTRADFVQQGHEYRDVQCLLPGQTFMATQPFASPACELQLPIPSLISCPCIRGKPEHAAVAFNHVKITDGSIIWASCQAASYYDMIGSNCSMLSLPLIQWPGGKTHYNLNVLRQRH